MLLLNFVLALCIFTGDLSLMPFTKIKNHFMKNILFSIVIIILIFGQGCKPSNNRNINPKTLSDISLAKAPNSTISDSTSRKLTKEATISFETKDFKSACTEIRNLISKHQGLINKESNYVQENKDLAASFDARIPAKSFNLFLQEMESVNGKIVDKQITIDDITADYLDVEARLKSKKELEARYIQILAKATKVTEMLEIEKQLNDQRTEIESIEGRFKFMQHEVANNLVHITITEPKIATSGFFGKMLKALSTGWTILLDFLIAVLSLWPFIVLGTGVWFFLRRYRIKQKEKMKILMGQ